MHLGIKSHIMSRLFAVVAVVLVSFVLIVNFFFYAIMQNGISARGKYDAQKNQYQVDRAISEAYKLLEVISLNPNVTRFLSTRVYVSESDRIVAINHLMHDLDNSIILNKYIHSFCLVTSDGQSYWDVCPYDNYFIELFKKSALDGKSPSDNLGFTKGYTLPSRAGGGTSQNVVSFVFNIFQITGKTPLVIGQLIVNMDLSTLVADIVTESSPFQQLVILDGDNNIIYLSNGDPNELAGIAGKLQSESENINGIHYFTNKLDSCNLKIVSKMDSVKIGLITDVPLLGEALLIIAISMLLLYALMVPYLLRFSKQIVSLDKALKQVARGNLDVSTDLTGALELTNISYRFNDMVQKTKQFMKDALANQEARQKASFELLLAKINPHFIYNTLNSVIYLARQNKDDEIIKLTSSFIYLLQDSIHAGNNSLFENIKTELQVIDKYVIIQKFRYADRFEFTCKSDEHLDDLQIPKNILQPLIENAILHGVCPKEEVGHIELEITQTGGFIHIRVSDDGVGIDPEMLEQLLSTRASEQPGEQHLMMRSIGITNIVERIKYIYGSNCTFDIVSTCDAGTTIRMVLPVLSIEEIEEISQR